LETKVNKNSNLKYIDQRPRDTCHLIN